MAVNYNTMMRRDKKWIQKCRALVAASDRMIAAIFETGGARLMANGLSEDDLKKGTDDGSLGVEEETPVATACIERL